MEGNGLLLLDADRAPNPRRVRIFLAEKNIKIPIRKIDLVNKEHMQEAFKQINPYQTVPVLTLDDGTNISESIAICRYIEALHPRPSLFGKTPKQIGLIEMWNRRLEIGLFRMITFAFRHTHPGMAEHEMPQIKVWGEENLTKLDRELTFLNELLKSRSYFAGDYYSVADITAVVAIDFMKVVKRAIPEDCTELQAWYERVSSRSTMQA